MVGASSNIVPFGNLLLLMALFALMSIGWTRDDDWVPVALCLLAGHVRPYASYLSQARGEQIAVPVLPLIAMAALRYVSWKKRLTVLLLFFVFLVIVYVSSSVVRTHFDQVMEDIYTHRTGQTNASVGIHFQLWKVATLMLTRHPLTRVERDQLGPTLKTTRTGSLTTQEVTTFRHVHNEFLYSDAAPSVLGTSVLLALYLILAAYFLCATLCNDRISRTMGTMSLTFCVGFLLFGLIEMILIIMQTVAFYDVMVTMFTAYIHRRQQQLGAAPAF